MYKYELYISYFVNLLKFNKDLHMLHMYDFFNLYNCIISGFLINSHVNYKLRKYTM